MFRGNYKKTNIDGTPVGYIYGDVVLYEGKMYKAIFSTYESPFQNAETWEFVGGSAIMFSSQTPPINPVEGQQWEKNGIVYTYYYDGNNYSWVQF